MKISDIRASLKRLAERLDNQWAYAQTSIKDDIAVGQVESTMMGSGSRLSRKSATTA